MSAARKPGARAPGERKIHTVNTFVHICALILEILSLAAALFLLLSILQRFVPRLRRAEANWGLLALNTWWLQLMAAFVVAAGIAFYVGFQTSGEAEADMPPVTAENSPVNLFLQLDAGTTMEQIVAQEDSRDWEYSYGEGSRELASQVGAGIRFIDVIPAWSEESGVTGNLSYLTNQDLNGEILSVYFAQEEDGSNWLLYARLVIRTDSGTATCFYYPTDFTEWGNETGFNLELKGSKQLFKRHYLLETAQEVIDTAFPVVYPGGR